MVTGETVYDDMWPEPRDILAAVDDAERVLRDVRAAFQRGERGATLAAPRSVAGHASLAGTLAVRAGIAAAGATNCFYISRYATWAAAAAERLVALPALVSGHDDYR